MVPSIHACRSPLTVASTFTLSLMLVSEFNYIDTANSVNGKLAFGPPRPAHSWHALAEKVVQIQLSMPNLNTLLFTRPRGGDLEAFAAFVHDIKSAASLPIFSSSSSLSAPVYPVSSTAPAFTSSFSVSAGPHSSSSVPNFSSSGSIPVYPASSIYPTVSSTDPVTYPPPHETCTTRTLTYPVTTTYTTKEPCPTKPSSTTTRTVTTSYMTTATTTITYTVYPTPTSDPHSGPPSYPQGPGKPVYGGHDQPPNGHPVDPVHSGEPPKSYPGHPSGPVDGEHHPAGSTDNTGQPWWSSWTPSWGKHDHDAGNKGHGKSHRKGHSKHHHKHHNKQDVKQDGKHQEQHDSHQGPGQHSEFSTVDWFVDFWKEYSWWKPTGEEGLDQHPRAGW